MCDIRNINGGCKESVGSRKISVVNKTQNQYPVSYLYLYILSILIFHGTLSLTIIYCVCVYRYPVANPDALQVFHNVRKCIDFPYISLNVNPT